MLFQSPISSISLVRMRTKADIEWAKEKRVEISDDEVYVKLRGLPFDWTEEEIILFFKGMIITMQGFFSHV